MTTFSCTRDDQACSAWALCQGHIKLQELPYRRCQENSLLARMLSESIPAMQVMHEHPEWMRRIMKAAINIVVHNASKPSASQEITPVAAFWSETVSLCDLIQEIATTLPNQIKRLKPPQRSDGHTSDADQAEFRKAVLQNLGAVNPESPLELGIHMRLLASDRKSVV